MAELRVSGWDCCLLVVCVGRGVHVVGGVRVWGGVACGCRCKCMHAGHRAAVAFAISSGLLCCLSAARCVSDCLCCSKSLTSALAYQALA
jgi:hypothetical protein